MPGTDFFDDDLVKQRDAAKRIRMGPTEEPVETLGEGGGRDEVPVRPVSDFNLTRMAKHKAEVNEQATIASQELDRLRKRQEQLEQEKRSLEEMQRKHEDYERGKREMTEHLKRSLITLERQEVETQRLVEMLSSTRKRFKAMLNDVEDLKEEEWPEDAIRDNLARSLGVIEETRMEYNKALAKIEAVKGEAKTPSATATTAPTVLFDDHGYGHEAERPFSYWVKVGLAVSLPLVVTLLIIAIVYYVIHANALL